MIYIFFCIIFATENYFPSEECVLCFDAEPQIAFKPCGHFCLCKPCATKLQNKKPKLCVICRQKYKELEHVEEPSSDCIEVFSIGKNKRMIVDEFERRLWELFPGGSGMKLISTSTLQSDYRRGLPKQKEKYRKMLESHAFKVAPALHHWLCGDMKHMLDSLAAPKPDAVSTKLTDKTVQTIELIETYIETIKSHEEARGTVFAEIYEREDPYEMDILDITMKQFFGDLLPFPQTPLLQLLRKNISTDRTKLREKIKRRLEGI